MKIPLIGALAVGIWYWVLTQLLAHEPVGIALFRPALLGLAFNSMAEHLAAGRFDIDPSAIDFEGFQIGDRTVAYFGVFCALLRLPLVFISDWGRIDFTRVSCLLAVCLGAWCQLNSVLLVRESVPASTRRGWLTVAMIACIVLGGQQIQYPRPSLYQEVIDWAGALAMAFVFLATRGLVTPRGFDRSTLCGMAVCAGLALLTRVSFGVGLYAALAGLLLVRRRGLVAPGIVLLVFALAAGGVNYGRWGNPLVFADFAHYGMSQDVYPDRLVRMAAYGAFNLSRIWIGLSYYFVPVWAIVRPDGQFLWGAAQTRLFDSIEIPPSSFLVSDPLLLGLCVVGVLTVRQRDAVALLCGLAVPPLLMLCAISLSYRYRMEFSPLLVFGALLGFRHLGQRTAPRSLSRGGKVAIGGAVVLCIIVSHAEAALYAVSPWGPVEQYVLKDGWIGTYAARLRNGP